MYEVIGLCCQTSRDPQHWNGHGGKFKFSILCLFDLFSCSNVIYDCKNYIRLTLFNGTLFIQAW